METWFLLETGAHSAAWNMALDEALLGAAPRLGRPVLRFYGWTEAAATFGYSQRYAEVERVTPLRPLVRRPTGGGLVPHDRDWTYTLVFPPGHPWYELRARESYRRMHDWLHRAFGRVGLSTRLAPGAIPGAGQCFVGAEEFDVLWREAKIAGAAQRRAITGLLIQGSVQPPAEAPARGDWEQAVGEIARSDWVVTWEPYAPPPDLLDQTEFLAREKYGCDRHNRKR